MRSALPAILFLLLAATGLRAEYMPGFTLNGHVSDSDLVVLVEVGDDGRCKVVEAWGGSAEPGDEIAVDREDLLRHRPDEARRAVLFLAGRRLVRDEAGVAWIRKGRVSLLPDNWGWGIAYPEGWRDPTPTQLRKAVALARADAAEIASIAALPPGPDSVKAASEFLARPRPEVDWYVGESPAPLDDRSTWRTVCYTDEIGRALWSLLAKVRPDPPVSPAERVAWREAVAALRPGPVRLVHLRILARAAPGIEDYRVLLRCYVTAADMIERSSAGAAMLIAAPGRTVSYLLEQIDIEKPERTIVALHLLARAAGRAARSSEDADGFPIERLLDVATGLGREIVSRPRGPAIDSLGYSIVGILGRTRRPAELPVLLLLARSGHACRGQALVELRRLAQRDWEAGDERWPPHLESLTELPRVR